MGKSKLINNLDSIVKEPLIIEGLEMNTGNEILKETRNLPELCKLFGDCWVEGEICVLVGDTNVGKTILAMQIGLCIADPTLPTVFARFLFRWTKHSGFILSVVLRINKEFLSNI